MQREQRVAGDGGVDRRPRERRDRGERGVAGALAPGRAAAHPQEVEAGEDPRLRAQQPRRAEQHEHRPAAAGARRLEHRRPHDERQVRDVDVAARGEEREVEAREQQQRGGDRADQRREGDPSRAGRPPTPATGTRRASSPPSTRSPPSPSSDSSAPTAIASGCSVGTAEALEERRLQVEHLAAPQQRVVGVVVRVGGEDEEPDEEAHAQHGEGDLGERVGAGTARAGRDRGVGPPRGERRCFHARGRPRSGGMAVAPGSNPGGRRPSSPFLR